MRVCRRGAVGARRLLRRWRSPPRRHLSWSSVGGGQDPQGEELPPDLALNWPEGTYPFAGWRTEQGPYVVFVSGNTDKVDEIKSMLGGDSFRNLKMASMSVELPELQGTPEDIVIEKARLALEMCEAPVLVEDVCLSFDALGGMPGPYIKWFVEAMGQEGVVKLLEPYEDKTATALCSYALAWPGSDEPKTFSGTCSGRIVSPRGESSFGWDPIFEPDEQPGLRGQNEDGARQTFAEMDLADKNKISHRNRALRRMKNWFKINGASMFEEARRSSIIM